MHQFAGKTPSSAIAAQSRAEPTHLQEQQQQLE
jgi:hypothetical protein